MMEAVYECPECGDRKLVQYQETFSPTIWCDCGVFALMERESIGDQNP